MARHIIKQSSQPSVQHERLVERLVEELRAGVNPQPAFIEREMRSGASREANVIWDDWAGVAEEERSDIIRQAYSQFDNNIAETIEFALGYTGAEAVAAGLLPYIVYYAHRGRVALMDRETAKDTECARTILGEKSRELRYPTEEAAELAIERLETSLPGSSWRLKHEIET